VVLAGWVRTPVIDRSFERIADPVIKVLVVGWYGRGKLNNRSQIAVGLRIPG